MAKDYATLRKEASQAKWRHRKAKAMFPINMFRIALAHSLIKLGLRVHRKYATGVLQRIAVQYVEESGGIIVL